MHHFNAINRYPLFITSDFDFSLDQPLFFDILKKTQGPKNSKLKKKLDNSRKKLKVLASF